MNYKQITEELKNLEVKDLESALKHEILQSFKGFFNDDKSKKNNEIKFLYDEDIDEIVSGFEYHIEQLLREYENYSMKIVNKVRNKER